MIEKMVKYHEFVGLVRQEAKAQGADMSEFESNSEVVSVAASIWNDRKEELKAADRSEAERIASDEVTVDE